MTNLATIAGGITALAGIVFLIARYFPAKTVAEKEQDGEQKIVDEYDQGKKTGRPGA